MAIKRPSLDRLEKFCVVSLFLTLILMFSSTAAYVLDLMLSGADYVALMINI